MTESATANDSRRETAKRPGRLLRRDSRDPATGWLAARLIPGASPLLPRLTVRIELMA